MESEVGIFYLELESDKFINDSYESNNEISESIITDDIEQNILEGKKMIISFNTDYLCFYLKFIVKKFPIYSTILKQIIIDLEHQSKNQYQNDEEDQYEISFSLENEATIIEILNNGQLKSYFRNIISLTSFCELCLIVEDIAKFIVEE